MLLKKSLFIIAMIGLIIPFVSACNLPESDSVGTEIAASVALTQTAIVLEAQPPTVQPSPTLEPTLTPEPTVEKTPAESELSRVEFEAGATAAQLSGRLAPGNVDHYILRAEANQQLALSVYPPGVVAVAVIGEDGVVIKSDLDNATDWTGTLPASQEYYLDVTSIVQIETDYTLEVSIPPLEPVATTGEVAGAIGYPEASIPPLHIVAYNQDNGFWYYLATGENTFYYLLPGLPPGKYHIAAYAKNGLNGAYMSGGAPVVVTVTLGETTEGVDLTQWFAAGSGPYPNDPVGW